MNNTSSRDLHPWSPTQPTAYFNQTVSHWTQQTGILFISGYLKASKSRARREIPIETLNFRVARHISPTTPNRPTLKPVLIHP
jgi:hypothetical protein